MIEKKLSEAIEKLYPILLDRCCGLLRSRQEGRELLHDVIGHVMDTEERRAKLVDLLERDKLDPYLSRCVYLSAYSKTSGYNQKKMKSVELTEYTEYRMSLKSHDDSMASMMLMITGEHLDGLIAQLPEFDAELLRLWTLPGFSYDAAAEVTGIKKQILIRSVFESIQKLRKYVHHTNRSSGSISE